LSNPVARVENIARAGFLARGIVYILLGYFAFTTRGIAEEGTGGVLAEIYDVPGGTILLGLIAIGLAGYGFFRLYDAIIGLEPQSAGWKGQAVRIGHGASGVAHFFLAATAAKLAMNSGQDAASQASGSQQDAAATVLSLPFGSIFLAIVVAGFLFAALQQAKKAWSGKFMAKLDADAPAIVEPVGRVGYAARAIVFLLVGYMLVRASMFESAQEAGGVGEVFSQLSGFGILYMLVAVGLLMFGIFSLVMARYRRIRDEDVIERIKALRFA